MRYVGNKMATFVMQSLGCDVSAINTVHYSKHPSACNYCLVWSLMKIAGNHTAYKQVKGTKTSPDQILDLYDGLRQSSLNDFDVLLTGYMPSAAAVQTVGKIGRDIKFNAGTKPGSFFWGELAPMDKITRAWTGVAVRHMYLGVEMCSSPCKVGLVHSPCGSTWWLAPVNKDADG